MPAINQRIPNFLGGVSQQPDTIKYPGQLRVCDNAVPDVTFGLMKRPPGEFVKTLTNANADGYWYEILRDGDEKYLVQMTALSSYSGTKPIRIWNLLTGVEQSLTNSNGDSLFSYMEQSGTTIPYATQTIQDYTIISNPHKTVTTTGTTDAPLANGNYAFARLDTIAYNTEYILYTGSTAPAANKYYRVTALSVDKGTNDGNTWDDTNKDGRYAGLAQFSFSDSLCEDVEGHVTVNAASYVDSNTANYDGGGTAQSNFLGYTQNYKTRYTAQIVLKDGGLIKTGSESTALSRHHDITIEGISYRVKVKAVEEVDTYESVSGIAFHRTPKNPDKGKLSMTNLISALHASINSSLNNVTSEVIGSGMYLYGSAAPTVNFLGGAVNENMNIIGNTAQDVSRLPSQCKHGYIAQIANSENVDADNYYVKFYADNGVQGSGSWEECVRPHNFSAGSDPMVKGLDPANMPHALVNNRNGTFTFKKLDETTANADSNDNYWKYREVGDDITNPFPSFKGLKISKIFFHRNRLGLIANEQVVMSRPGDYFNFQIVSAITTSDDNPVDITVSDIKPAFINHVLPIQKGVMMFSDNGQFLLFTESDIFSPKTARLKKLSSYETYPALDPIDMGTSVMFTSNVSAYARAFEATIVDDDIPPKIIEQTRVVPEFIPKDITISTVSSAIGIVSFGKKNSSEIYHYKYYDAGDRRDQSAWYSWTVQGKLQHCLYTGGSFWTVTKQGPDGGYQTMVLSKHEYVTEATSGRTYVLGGEATDVGSPLKTARWFEACLDNMTIPTAINYTAQGGSVTGPDFTDLTLAYTPHTADNFYAVALSGTDTAGNEVAGTVIEATSVGTNKATFEGVNMTGWVVAVGYQYTSTITLPSYYLAFDQGKYDLDADLRITGINFEMGIGGPMEFHLESTYADMDDYIQYESGLKLDDSDFGKPPSQMTKSIRVPIQKKNEKYNLTIKIPDPFSTAIISGSWDGRYNQRRHVRR
ncbi:tail tube protein B [Cyanophage NATL2A-133]|uniref:Tail tube protein B n=1 Tax=Cyanophage NATL2A-133 TaxID=445692 RepID=E3SP50_9CAUD|nr:tail protein [Cyanophage NATL2A-133]ADP00167.1 tail tube protein B [Cyanophage NATL2A-133]